MLKPQNNIFPDFVANFTTFDPIILKGVIAVNIDVGDGRQKIGDGVTRWSSLSYTGGSTIGNKTIQSGTPLNNQLIRYEDLYGTWRYTLQGKIDGVTNWSTVDDVFPTFCILIEADDITDEPTGRIKVSDGVTQSNLIPWIWFNFNDFPTGYSLEYNGTTLDYVKYQPYDVLPFATTPIGKVLLDDGTWGYPEIIGPVTNLTTTLLETDDLYAFDTITLGGFPTEPTSVTITTDGTDAYIDNQKIWTASNDGTGSGLDADSLRGYYPSDFASMSYANSTFATIGHLHTGTYVRYLGEFATDPTSFATGDEYWDTVTPCLRKYINVSVGWIRVNP